MEVLYWKRDKLLKMARVKVHPKPNRYRDTMASAKDVISARYGKPVLLKMTEREYYDAAHELLPCEMELSRPGLCQAPAPKMMGMVVSIQR